MMRVSGCWFQGEEKEPGAAEVAECGLEAEESEGCWCALSALSMSEDPSGGIESNPIAIWAKLESVPLAQRPGARSML